MINTWMNAFGHHPDMVISEAAALAIKKSQFLPSLPEFAGYIRRAELILEARRVDDQHLRDGKTWAGAGMKSGEIAQMLRIGSAASDPMKIKKSKEIENFLLWQGQHKSFDLCEDCMKDAKEWTKRTPTIKTTEEATNEF